MNYQEKIRTAMKQKQPLYLVEKGLGGLHEILFLQETIQGNSAFYHCHRILDTHKPPELCHVLSEKTQDQEYFFLEEENWAVMCEVYQSLDNALLYSNVELDILFNQENIRRKLR